MSLNIDNILNGTASKRIKLGYQNFTQNDYTDSGSKEFMNLYEKESLSDIVDNSIYIMKDPFNGIKFYEKVVLDPSFCLFTSYESELQKVRSVIESAEKLHIPDKQKELYEALESKLVDLIDKSKNIRIVCEYVKENIDSDFEKNLSDILY